MDLNGTKLLAAVEFAPGNTRGREDTRDTLVTEVVADFPFCFGPIRAFIETEQQKKEATLLYACINTHVTQANTYDNLPRKSRNTGSCTYVFLIFVASVFGTCFLFMF